MFCLWEILVDPFFRDKPGEFETIVMWTDKNGVQIVGECTVFGIHISFQLCSYLNSKNAGRVYKIDERVVVESLWYSDVFNRLDG